MRISVIICTHNPDPQRLRRTLRGLREQTLPPADWESLLIDNASHSPIEVATLADSAPSSLRIVREASLGLSTARRRGLAEARGEIAVLVDDDNVLAPDYLENTRAALDRLPHVGAIGGKSLPEFASPLGSDDWRREFFPLLALRDLRDVELVSQGLRPGGALKNQYPPFAPIGAGMALRRAAFAVWLQRPATAISDRRGRELSSAGDNDIVLTLMRAGWEVAYSPALRLTHLIPEARLAPAYLARLNRSLQKSWQQVLALHDASPWPPLPRGTLLLRFAKAWFVHRAWRGSAAYIRWQGACGHFEGRVS
jgi:glycosyltransferase involved in cell wall biosynthesis